MCLLFIWKHDLLSFTSTAMEPGANYCDWPFSGKYGNEVSGIRYSPENDVSSIRYSPESGLKRPSIKTPSTGICS